MNDDEILAGLREIDRVQSATPLQDAIDKLGADGDGLEVDVGRDQAGHAGVSLEGSKTLGKDWSVAGAVQWAKDVGYAAIGKVKWTPRGKS